MDESLKDHGCSAIRPLVRYVRAIPERDHARPVQRESSGAAHAATLMEEFFHLWLESTRSGAAVFRWGWKARVVGDKESEAYGSGAAALVPYQAVKAMLTTGHTVRQIADHFFVSEALVHLRIRVTKIGARRKGA